MPYDLTIIGAGWAGFNAALRAKALGLKVALIERDQIGGTCLNRGCIPTKALIQSAKIYSLSKKSATFGIETAHPQINFPAVCARKEKIIRQLESGMQFRLKGIDFLSGEAKITSSHCVNLSGQTIATKSILIATGSKPAQLPSLKFDSQKIISSDEIINLKEIPASLLIIGAGVIGCEFASLFASLGTEVELVEKMPQVLPGEDKEVAKKLENIFKKKGIKVNTATRASGFDFSKYTLVLLCVGRVPLTENLGLEDLGLKLEKRAIVVDDYLQTNLKGIYAAGDCTGQIMLAHYAAYQGRIAAENIASGQNQKKISATAVPYCIFTDPQIASVGLKEEAGGTSKVHKFDFMGLAMGRILDETEGFIKIISDKKSEVILGVSIIGPQATELISVACLAIGAKLKISQIRDTIFAHPTISEAISEALQ